MFNCIRCKIPYEEEGVEAYYCASCLLTKKELAAQIDANYVPRPKVKTALEEYDEAPKGPGGFMRITL